MGIRWRTESVGDYYTRIDADVPTLMGSASGAVSRHLTKSIKEKTPIGDRKAWTKEQKIKRYGQEWRLKRDINQANLTRYAGKYLSGTYTDVPYAPSVEYRTFNPRPIVAVNARALRFWSEREGKYIFRKSVRHPGSGGHYMFLRGTGETYTQLGRILRPELERWLRKFRRAKATRQRIPVPGSAIVAYEKKGIAKSDRDLKISALRKSLND